MHVLLAVGFGPDVELVMVMLVEFPFIIGLLVEIPFIIGLLVEFPFIIGLLVEIPVIIEMLVEFVSGRVAGIDCDVLGTFSCSVLEGGWVEVAISFLGSCGD